LDATRVVTALNSELDATQKQLEAWRCYHLGIAFTENAKLPEAIGLLRLGRSLAETASELHAARANVPGGSSRAVGARITALAEMDELQKLVRVQICLAHAGVVLAEEEAATSTPSYAAKTRATTEVGDAGDKMLLQRLRTWDGGSKTDQYGGASLPFRIFALPPPFEPVPARPLVFDIALNGMIVPSLDHRVPKRAQSKPKAKPRAAEEAPASAEEEEQEAAAGDEEGDKKGWFSSFWG
jgi:signal recognition particle subunit SRP68